MSDIIQELRGLLAAERKALRDMKESGAPSNVLLDTWLKVSGGLNQASIAALPALLDRLEAAEADNAKIRKMLAPQWFYADGYSSEDCCDSPAEALCELDLEPGKHLRQVDCAGPMPSIWCVVHVLTEEEKGALDTDDDEIITEFSSKEEAEAAIQEVKP